MTTQKLYLKEQILSAGARVLSVRSETADKAWIQLDRTIFHAQGGGQKSDVGTLGGAQVLAVAHTPDGGVDHLVLLPAGTTLVEGQTVQLEVDGAARSLNARYHTAGHLIADLVMARFPSLRARQGHQWPGEARVEFDGTLATPAELTQILNDDLQDAITRDLPVIQVGDPFSSRAIQIGDFPAMPCGGTHVAHLAELVEVRVRQVKAKGGNLRVGYGL